MGSGSQPAGWTALVLAGGRGSRLGNDDKAAITIDGTSALDHLLSGLPESVPVVVVGPEHPTSRPVTVRREVPAHGGPVAAIAAGLTAVNTSITALLAVDMPWAGVLIRNLVAEFASCEAAALVPVDGSGFAQPLCAVVRTSALREALGQLGDPTGRSLRALMSFVDVCERPLDEAELFWLDDIDTPEDLRRARMPRSPTPLVPQLVDSSEPTTPDEGATPPMKPWIDAVCRELTVPADVSVDVILDVARVSAHHVERPAAPVTTFLLGMAVAGGMDLDEAAAKVQNLAANWPTSHEEPQ